MWLQFLTIYIFIYLLLRSDEIEGKWLSSTATVTVQTSIHKAYGLYSQLDAHPTWSPWLKSVEYDRASGNSFWTLSSLGLTYSWRAKNIKMEPPYVIEWESLDGLPNKGRVEFISEEAPSSHSRDIEFEQIMDGQLPIIDNEDIIASSLTNSITTHQASASVRNSATSDRTQTTRMKLTLSYDLPKAAAVALKALGPLGRRFITRTLTKDLNRFQRLIESTDDEELQRRVSQLCYQQKQLQS